MSRHYDLRCYAGDRIEFTSPLGIHFAGFDWVSGMNARDHVLNAHRKAVEDGTAAPALMEQKAEILASRRSWSE